MHMSVGNLTEIGHLTNAHCRNDTCETLVMHCGWLVCLAWYSSLTIRFTLVELDTAVRVHT